MDCITRLELAKSVNTAGARYLKQIFTVPFFKVVTHKCIMLNPFEFALSIMNLDNESLCMYNTRVRIPCHKGA
jgi:hypothetical protein